jgi:hypothetical protein
MFAEDPPQSTKFVDRLISLAIAAICGYLLGRVLGHFAVIFFGQSFGIVWLSTVGFSIFGFVAPARSRALWTRVWTFVLELIYKLIDTRRFYR